MPAAPLPPRSRCSNAAPAAIRRASPTPSWSSLGSTARTARRRRRKRYSRMRGGSSARPRTKSANANAGCDRRPLWHSIQAGAVALGGHPLALDRVGADLLGDDAAERRPFAARDVFFRVPQIGADQRLAAVEIHFFGGDQDAAARHLAVDGERPQQRRIG